MLGLISSDLAAAIASRQILRYASYAYDAESGLYYCSARSYDPATRQFISKDSAEADGEESAYQYCGWEPVGKVDVNGCSHHSVVSCGSATRKTVANFAWHIALALPPYGGSSEKMVVFETVHIANRSNTYCYVKASMRTWVVGQMKTQFTKSGTIKANGTVTWNVLKNGFLADSDIRVDGWGTSRWRFYLEVQTS